MVFEDPHEQRQFQAHERSHGKDQSVENDGKATQPGEAQKQQRRRTTAQQRHAEFHLHEHPRQAAIDKTREPGTHPQREKVDADDERELRDGVAQHVAGKRPGKQFVDQAAGGDDQHVQEEDRRPIHPLVLNEWPPR